MKSTKTYKQCRLRNTLKSTMDTVWIPSVFAFKGRNIEIRPTPTAAFEPGWVVEEVYPGIWDQEDADNSRANHKRFDTVLGG